MLGQQLHRLPLMRRVGVGVQEDDCRRGDALGLQPRCGREHGLFVERNAHAAVDGHPLRHLQAQAARHQGRRLDDADVVELVLALAPDLERVAETLGRDEPGRCALALDQRVAEQRGGVHQPADVGWRNRAFAQQPVDPRHDAARGVVVRGQLLAADLAAGLSVVDNDIGERAPDVDPQPEPLRHHRPNVQPIRSKPCPRTTSVIPALVAGIHLSARSAV